MRATDANGSLAQSRGIREPEKAHKGQSPEPSPTGPDPAPRRAGVTKSEIQPRTCATIHPHHSLARLPQSRDLWQDAGRLDHRAGQSRDTGLAGSNQTSS